MISRENSIQICASCTTKRDEVAVGCEVPDFERLSAAVEHFEHTVVGQDSQGSCRLATPGNAPERPLCHVYKGCNHCILCCYCE